MLSGGQALAVAPECQLGVSQDIDGDGGIDMVVGVPTGSTTAASGAGVVDVRLSGGNNQRVGQSFFSGLPAAGATDRFGSAVQVLDYTGDFCEELAIGAPGSAGRGAVDVVRGSATGLDRQGALQLKGKQAGEHFGAALAGISDQLWVGAPDRTVSGKARAGAIDHYRLSGTSAPVLVETITENTRGVAGVAEAGDRFGSVLQLVEGVGGWELAVGQPQEDVGSRVDAGSVTVLRFNPDTRRVVESRSIEQGLAGSSSVAERGDRFGAAVAGAGGRIAVGSPGEDVGSVRDAGSVTLVALTPANSAAAQCRRAYYQGAGGLGSAADSGDRLGATLALPPSGFVPDSETPDDHLMDGVLVGVAGEDIGTTRDAGVVVEMHFGSDDKMSSSSFGSSAGGHTGERYGSVMVKDI